MATPELRTARLLLRPLTREHLEALRADRARFAKMIDAHVPEEWPGRDYLEALPFFLGVLEQNPSPWSFVLIDRTTRRIAGDAGFKGAPDAVGNVELGYSILPAFRGRGLAQEASFELLRWARTHPGVRTITAECMETNAPSIRVLTKVGFRQAGRAGGLIAWQHMATLKALP